MAREAPSQPKPLPVYVVHGTEALLKAQATARIFRDELGIAADDPSCVSYDDKSDIADVLDELRTVPMFSGHRVVMLQDADDFITRYRGKLEDYCASPTDSASLLLSCNRFDARTKLHRACSKIGKVIRCAPLAGKDIAAWVRQQATQQYQKQIDWPTATGLRRLIGDDLGTLDCELSKLATYVGERPAINTEDVAQLVGLHREERVFGIADALADKDASRALHLWQQVWATDRAAPGRSIGGLAWALRRYLQAKTSVEQGADVAQIARQFYTTADELGARLRRCTVDDLEEQLLRLLEVDLGVKTGLSQVRTAIERLIVRLCAAT